jgi:poly(3-hydroxybutyrate) depolymerase
MVHGYSDHWLRGMRSFTAVFLLPLLVCATSFPQANKVKIIDSRHYSQVMGEIRNYRIFLPTGYDDDPGKRYPVIYFYHGWSQRYFGPTMGSGYDMGEDNGGDNIANYVSGHDVIVVKPDGYNRSPDEEYYLRPYNVSPVETHRQFPIYFPELVDHIDARFRTIADRGHRAISGLSMGGFMTFWIGGKYPHLLTAAGNFCGSTEFWVGPKEMPVEYRHIDMHENYGGMKVRLHYGNEDFIRCYHRDMNRVWTQVMDHYTFKIYPAAHSTCGLGDMFDFLMETFENPPVKPDRWDHIDVYPGFSVWGYQVASDRLVPGFTILENVDERGFRCSVREFLPDGELMPFVDLTVKTAPLYQKNQEYLVNDVDHYLGIFSRSLLKSDDQGRLTIKLDGSLHEIGINTADAPPNVCVADWEISNMPWAAPGKDVAVSVRLVNKGGSRAAGVSAKLEGTRSSARVEGHAAAYGDIGINETKDPANPFTFRVQVDSIAVERFRLLITDRDHHEWTEFVDIPLMMDRPEINDFVIADGRTFMVAAAGDDTISLLLGAGNGDGVANPGESFVILAGDPECYRRTFLYASDPYVNPGGIHARISDNWGSYDHVGGSAKYSVPLLASDCPDGHRVEFFAEYWLPDYPDHIIKKGKITITVSGEDHTAPLVQWVRLSGNNTVQARVHDGGKVRSVRAVLHLQDDPGRSLEVGLNDDGLEGDRAAGDHVFSRKITGQSFGLYTVEIRAADTFGNTRVVKEPHIFVLH